MSKAGVHLETNPLLAKLRDGGHGASVVRFFGLLEVAGDRVRVFDDLSQESWVDLSAADVVAVSEVDREGLTWNSVIVAGDAEVSRVVRVKSRADAAKDLCHGAASSEGPPIVARWNDFRYWTSGERFRDSRIPYILLCRQQYGGMIANTNEWIDILEGLPEKTNEILDLIEQLRDQVRGFENARARC